MPSAVIMAGGTGGHIFPALAVAKELKLQGWNILWLGTEDRLEAKLVPEHGFPIHFLPVKGLRGKGLSAKVKSIIGVIKSIFSALSSLRDARPDVVLGFGGYPSFPGGVAAKLLARPILIHEQNATAGLTNKLLGKIAKQVFLGFPSAASAFALPSSQVHFVGNPVRTEIIAKTYTGNTVQKEPTPRPFRLLILGGSLGAKPLNEQVPEILSNMHDSNHLAIVHQCGKDNEMNVSATYLKRGLNANVRAFIDDMAGAYEWADAVICRAGALTVAEVAKAGVAACFIPLPHAVDDHQTKNAQYLAEYDAAWVLAQSQIQKQLAPIVSEWLGNRETCVQMGERAKRRFPNDAITPIVDACKQYVKESPCQLK